MSISHRAIKGCGYMGSNGQPGQVTKQQYAFEDESGDVPSGKKPRYIHRPGQTTHYAVALIVVNDPEPLTFAVRSHRALLRERARPEFHFSDMKENERCELLEAIACVRFEVLGLVL